MSAAVGGHSRRSSGRLTCNHIEDDQPSFLSYLRVVSDERSMHGGLFLDRCAACGWERSGRTRQPSKACRLHPANRVSVRWPEGRVAPYALKVLRDVSPLARKMRLADVSASMAKGRPFEMDVVVEYQRAHLSRELLQAGFLVTIETVRRRGFGQKEPFPGDEMKFRIEHIFHQQRPVPLFARQLEQGSSLCLRGSTWLERASSLTYPNRGR